jgi:D-3-phosphoglycerate dehydrogenase
MMNKCTIAITIRSFNLNGPPMAKLRDSCTIGYINRSGERLSESGLLAAIDGASGVIAGTEPFTRRVLDASPHLRVISRVGRGTDSIDIAAAQARGIQICITPEAPVLAVAEHTLALIFALCKRICPYNQEMRTGVHVNVPTTLLSGKTVGIVGFGRIGTRVGSMLSSLGCRILVHDPIVEREGGQDVTFTGSLEDLASRADIITLHATPRPDGRPIFDERAFSHCRKGVLFINTARGSLVDERGLASAIGDGTVAGAGLDVFSGEPYSGPLLGLPQVIATPHVASNTVETRQRMEMEAVENLIHGLAGGPV